MTMMAHHEWSKAARKIIGRIRAGGQHFPPEMFIGTTLDEQRRLVTFALARWAAVMAKAEVQYAAAVADADRWRTEHEAAIALLHQWLADHPAEAESEEPEAADA